MVREELGLQVRKVRVVAAGGEIVGPTSNQGLSLTESLCEADSRRKALQDVEILAAAGGAVIFSRVDPVEYCLGRALSAADRCSIHPNTGDGLMFWEDFSSFAFR